MLKNKIIDIEGRNSSILNNNNVLEICKLINLGHTYKSISEKFLIQSFLKSSVDSLNSISFNTDLNSYRL